MKDRVSTQKASNGALRYGVYRSTGTRIHYEYIKLEDEPLQEPTPLDKAHILTDETAERIWKEETPTDPSLDDALFKLGTPPYRVGSVLTTARILDDTWLECDGSTFSAQTYPELYALLGTTTLPNISYSEDTTTYIKAKEE